MNSYFEDIFREFIFYHVIYKCVFQTAFGES